MDLENQLYNIQRLNLHKENTNKNRIMNYPFSSKGKVIYGPSKGKICDPSWVILKCEEDIVNYYKWFLSKKGVHLDSLLWGSHISIIKGNSRDIIPPEKEHLWEYNDNEIIDVFYGDLVTNNIHWWLEVKSPQLEEMRGKLGLKPHPDSGFHITIGKIKDK